MKLFLISLLSAAALALGAPLPVALGQADHDGHHGAQSDATRTGNGIVRYVDLPTAEIDIAHEPMPSLKWPAMRMTFKAQDASLLTGLKAGDKVEFDIVKSGSEFRIVRIRPLR